MVADPAAGAETTPHPPDSAAVAEPAPTVTIAHVLAAAQPVQSSVPKDTETLAPGTLTPAPAIKTKSSRGKMHVTWDDERKLRKKGYPASAQPDAVPLVPTAIPPTPNTTPERRRSGFFSKLSSRSSQPGTSVAATAGSTSHHHPPTPPESPGWKHHDSYFPEYTPIYPTTTFADPYARSFKLTPAEIQAQQHAARVGHAVAVHYPMLPPFADYQSAAPKTQGAWQSGQWGNSNWTGFGLSGEKLPDAEGKTFGAPMPKGVPVEDPKAGGGGAGAAGAKKGKGGGAGGEGEGGAAAEGGEQAEGGAGGGEGAGEGGEAAAGPVEGGAGGGGAKKKKKK